jgi:hypothetical protein
MFARMHLRKDHRHTIHLLLTVVLPGLMRARLRGALTVVTPERSPQLPALPLALVAATLAAFWTASPALGGDPAIEAIVDQVSSSNYQSSHLAVENMGLGLYGGPGYNMGYRNRDGWAGDGSLGNQETRLFMQDAFAAMGLQVSLQGSYLNVIGELPGTSTPENIYIIGAHYDHILGDRPGGDDNASGTAAVLESARVLSQYQFESTIRFVGFNAEEDGLLGSNDYVHNFVITHGDNIAGMANLDMILRPSWDGDPQQPVDVDLGTRTGHAPSVAWADAYRLAAADYVPTLVLDPTTFNVNGGSDQDPFVVAGYPAFLAIENTAQEIWGGSNAYYHTYNDASDRLANHPGGPNGVTYDYAFATDVTRAVVALVAEKAGLVRELGCDFDADGSCGIHDIDALVEEIVANTGSPIFDLTGDGEVTLEDVTDPHDGWLRLAGEENLGPGLSYIEADITVDGIVDGIDFAGWNDNKFTSTGMWSLGDLDANGVTDGLDFIIWNNFKLTSSGVAVPEPATVVGSLLGLWILAGVQRRWTP